MKDDKGTEREYAGLWTSSGAGLDRWKSDQVQLGSYLGFGRKKENQKYDDRSKNENQKYDHKSIPGIVSSNDMGSVRSHLVGEIVGNKSGCWGDSSLKDQTFDFLYFFYFRSTCTQNCDECFQQLEDLVQCGKGLGRWQ